MTILENISGLTYSVRIPVLKKGNPTDFSLVHSATNTPYLFDIHNDWNRSNGMISFEFTFETTPFSGQYNYILYANQKKLSEGLCLLNDGQQIESVGEDFYFDYEAVPSTDGFISDAKITFVDQDGNVLGDITVNQFDNETITITQRDPEVHWDEILDKPTIGDGLVQLISERGDEIGHFFLNSTSDYRITIPDPEVGNGEIDIKVNGESVGHFNLNDSADKEIRITVPTKTSDLTNDAGFITGYTETDPVFTASPAHGITSQDITIWNNKSDFSGSYTDLTNKPSIPTKTSDLTNDSGFLTTETDPVFTASPAHGITNQDITIWNNKSDFSGSYTDLTNKPSIPTKTSDLTNDSGFLTTETDPVFAASPAHGITSQDITIWNNKSDFSGSYNDLTNKPSIPTKTSDLTNDSGFLTTETDPVFTASPAHGITSTDITNWNNKSDFSGSYNDLTNKPSIPTNTSDLTNDSGFLTTETDPVFTASPAHGITSNDITNWNNKSNFSGSYNDLTNKPTIGNGTVTIKQGENTLGTFSLNAVENQTITIPDHVTLTQEEYDALEEVDPDTIYLITDPVSWNDIVDKPTIPTKTSDLTNDSGFITGYTETDPVFTASPAHGITSQDITNWNNKGTSNFSGSYTDLTDKPTIPVIWQGTLQQYEALTSYDNNTLYIITDQTQQFTVYDSTITLKNGNDVLGYFTLNQSSNKEIDLSPILTSLQSRVNATETWAEWETNS